MADLRVINLDENHFECEGRKFFIRETLGFTRYRELQKLNMEFGYSATFHDIFKNIKTAWDMLNAVKLAEAAVVLHNIMYGVVSLQEKEDPALRICALFIDEEGEDPTVYDEAKMKDKIDCWGRELAVTPFFQLAANVVPQWINVYNSVSLNGLKVKEEQEEQLL